MVFDRGSIFSYVFICLALRLSMIHEFLLEILMFVTHRCFVSGGSGVSILCWKLVQSISLSLVKISLSIVNFSILSVVFLMVML